MLDDVDKLIDLDEDVVNEWEDMYIETGFKIYRSRWFCCHENRRWSCMLFTEVNVITIWNGKSRMTTSILFHHFIVLLREITWKFSKKSMTFIYTTLIEREKQWSLNIVWLEIVQHCLQQQWKSREKCRNVYCWSWSTPGSLRTS